MIEILEITKKILRIHLGPKIYMHGLLFWYGKYAFIQSQLIRYRVLGSIYYAFIRLSSYS